MLWLKNMRWKRPHFPLFLQNQNLTQWHVLLSHFWTSWARTTKLRPNKSSFQELWNSLFLCFSFLRTVFSSILVVSLLFNSRSSQGDITYLCVLGGFPYASLLILFSSLPALSFFSSILAPSLPTFLLSLMEEISTTDRPTDRCFDWISDSSFSKRHADRPTDRRNAFLYIDSWTKSSPDRPTDRPTAQPPNHRKKPSVGRSVSASVHQDNMLFMVAQSVNWFRRAATDRPTEIGMGGEEE